MYIICINHFTIALTLQVIPNVVNYHLGLANEISIPRFTKECMFTTSLTYYIAT